MVHIDESMGPVLQKITDFHLLRNENYFPRVFVDIALRMAKSHGLCFYTFVGGYSSEY